VLIFTISDVLSPAECWAWIEYSERVGYDEAPITTAHGFALRKDIRNNTRVMLDDETIAETLWERIKPFVPEEIEEEQETWTAIGLNERIRFYRYEPGQYFAPHYDGCFARSEIEESKLTLMVYLNDNFTGGETRFNLRYPHSEENVIPQMGSVLCFIHHLYHEGAAVLRGVKYVLRSDVMYCLKLM